MGIRITGISSPIFGLTWEFTDKNGKNSEHYIVPDKRIKVFFSSNYSEAKYDGIRKKLKDRIEETQLASVYISEGKEIDDAFCLEESDVCFYIIDNSEEIKETVLNEIEIARKRGVSHIFQLGEGGVFAGLWNLAKETGKGLEVDLKKIPVLQETVEVCEFFRLNPYQLTSAGAMIMVTDDGEALVEMMNEQGVPAALIGKLTDNNDKILRNGDEIRYIDRPAPDELMKIFEVSGF